MYSRPPVTGKLYLDWIAWLGSYSKFYLRSPSHKKKKKSWLPWTITQKFVYSWLAIFMIGWNLINWNCNLFQKTRSCVLSRGPWLDVNMGYTIILPHADVKSDNRSKFSNFFKNSGNSYFNCHIWIQHEKCI